MIVTVLQLIAVFAVPLLILRQREKGLVRTFGTIAMAYFWGIVLSLAVFLCRKLGLDIRLNADVGQIGSYVCIGLAIPLLMFGANLADVRRLAKPVLTSFALLIVSVSGVVLLFGRTLGASFPWGKELAAMAAGMYTGGSPNFNAVGVILGVPGDTIAIGNLSDMIVGTVFYIFILTLAKPLCAKVLDRHAKQGAYMRENGGAENVDALEWNGFHRGIVRNLALSLACVLVGAVIGFAIWKVKGGALTQHGPAAGMLKIQRLHQKLVGHGIGIIRIHGHFPAHHLLLPLHLVFRERGKKYKLRQKIQENLPGLRRAVYIVHGAVHAGVRIPVAAAFLHLAGQFLPGEMRRSLKHQMLQQMGKSAPLPVPLIHGPRAYPVLEGHYGMRLVLLNQNRQTISKTARHRFLG